MENEEHSNLPKPLPKNKFITGSDIGAYKDTLVDAYRSSGHIGVLNKIKQGNAVTADDILGMIMMEILEGGEDMLGTQLMLAEEGNLQGSTGVIVKRSELLRSVADIVAKRKELNQRASEVDLNSPAFTIFQKLCFDKMVRALEQLNIDNEMINLIVTKWSQNMADWGKELKKQLDEMAQ